ncbi:unnamed protein product [Caenorhabditis bovis]|uniref:Acyltransferase 3 domain-containing protein n=1 Tax=Caenorhabditis bovis TaxID=2654633 RepID=A0A8S1ECU8_9PELO|nr:unnamed protein product [Caenorhabditis bovis]
MPIFLSPALDNDSCQYNYWLNLLYIDNIVDTAHICYVISWYLATDLQIYLFTPILLLSFANFGAVKGFITASIVFLISTGFNAFQMLAWHFPPTQYQFGPKDSRYNSQKRYDLWNYYNPLIRCQIYVMGFVWIDRLLWVISLSSMLFVIMILQNYTSGNLWTPMENMMYSCFSRVVWGLALSWVIFSTYCRKGIINDFMSLPIWTPLARLSFCAYLIHIMVVAYFFGKTYSEIYFTTLPLFFVETVIPITVITFAIATLWSAMFELPFAKV